VDEGCPDAVGVSSRQTVNWDSGRSRPSMAKILRVNYENMVNHDNNSLFSQSKITISIVISKMKIASY